MTTIPHTSPHSPAASLPDPAAAVLTRAALLIRERGYSPHVPAGDYGPQPGPESAASAIEHAARVLYPDRADAADAAEEAAVRFAGYLWLAGLHTRRTSVHDVAGQPAAWEQSRRPAAGAVVAALSQAADVIEVRAVFAALDGAA